MVTVQFTHEGDKALLTTGDSPRVFSVDTCREIFTLTSHKEKVLAGCFSSDSKRVVRTGLRECAGSEVSLLCSADHGLARPVHQGVGHGERLLSAHHSRGQQVCARRRRLCC